MYYLYITSKGVRAYYCGLKTIPNSIPIPSPKAIHWKWSNGEYCFNVEK